MYVIRMVIYAVLMSLTIGPNKLAVTIVPNLVILVWDVPSNAGKLALSQLQPSATNVARKATSHVAAQRMPSSIGRKASHHHTVRERKNGKRTPVQDQLLMMPVKLVKGKAPISRIEWTYLGINPKLGVVGLVAMILMIYRSRSTNPMHGVLHLHPRSRTRITRSPAVTTSHLSPHEGTTLVMHHRTRIIHPVQRSTGFRRQDSLPETPMSGLGEVSCARVRFCCSVTNRL